jgi:hypothetical protein
METLSYYDLFMLLGLWKVEKKTNYLERTQGELHRLSTKLWFLEFTLTRIKSDHKRVTFWRIFRGIFIECNLRGKKLKNNKNHAENRSTYHQKFDGE